MGVQGLWQILEPVGKPVSLESLEGKVLAIDVSLWLHQAVKGAGANRERSRNPHLVTMFHRLVKLLFYRAKPVFVFDGLEIPHYKRRTLTRRKLKREVASMQLNKIQKRILGKIAQQHVTSAMDRKSDKGPSIDTEGALHALQFGSKAGSDTLFELPEDEPQLNQSNSEAELSGEDTDPEDIDQLLAQAMQSQSESLNTSFASSSSDIDVKSEGFLALPIEIQRELLMEAQEMKKDLRTTRDALPGNSQEFCDFQLTKLLSKGDLNRRLDEINKELSVKNNAVTVDWLHEKYATANGTLNIKRIIHENLREKQILFEDNGKMTKDDSVPAILKKTDSSSRSGSSIEELRERLIRQISNNTPASSQLEIAPIKVDNDRSELGSGPEERKSTPPLNETEPIHAPDNSQSVISDELKLDDVMQDDSLESIAQREKNLPTLDISPIKRNTQINRSPKPSSPKIQPIPTISNYSPRLSKSDRSDTIPPAKPCEPLKVKEPLVGGLPPKQLDASISSTKEEKPTLSSPVAKSKNNLSDSSEKSIHKRPEKCSINIDSTGAVASALLATINEHTIPVEPKSAEISASDSDDDDLMEVEDYSPRENFATNNPSTSKQNERPAPTFLPEPIGESLELLEKQRKAAEGAEKSMTEQIYEDCQSLLKLFGVPFMVAPGEAEAQCAWLESAGLASATLTEDSDVWLFGSRKVYRNVFNREKHAQFFSFDDIRNVLGLTREKMVLIAILTGCDYTDGVENVGVVAALEILAEFRQLDGSDDDLGVLQRFHDWWEGAQKGKFPPGSVTSTKMKLSKLNCIFPPSFPDPGVWDAYLKPNVDHSSEKFAWGMPECSELKEFLHSKVGWTHQKVDELMLPLMGKLKSRSNQTHISSFMIQLAKDPAQMKISNSKRVEMAVKKLKTTSPVKQTEGSSHGKDMEDSEAPASSTTSKSKPKTGKVSKKTTDKPKVPRKRKVPVPQIQAPKVSRARASKTKAASKIVDLRISESSSSEQDE